MTAKDGLGWVRMKHMSLLLILVLLGFCLEDVQCKRAFLSRLSVGGSTALGTEIFQEKPPKGWQYEWMASLRNKDDEHVCGGTLIDHQVVLTAAHCFDDLVIRNPPVSVDLGRRKRVGPDDTGFQKHYIKHVLIHKNYSRVNDFDNDAALLVLYSHTNQFFVPLASQSECFETEEGCKVHALGWGVLDYDKGPAEYLQVVSPPTVTRKVCQQHRRAQTLTENMLCAGNLPDGGIGNCMGDSGGPVFIVIGRYSQQVGIISWSNGCGDYNTPEVMTSVPRMRTWIDKQLESIYPFYIASHPQCREADKYCSSLHVV